MPKYNAYFRPELRIEDDPEFGGLRRGRRPVIFDVVAPDRETSLLPEGLRLVLHVNPRSMQLSYQKQTMYSGLSNITGSGSDVQGRRQTIAYEKYLDLLALFHGNGAMYDARGNITVQGYIKMTFDGGVHIGWFDGQFTVREAAEKPYQFEMSARFIIDQEILRWRSSELVGGLSGIDPQAVFQQTTVDQPPPPGQEQQGAAPATAVLSDGLFGSQIPGLPPGVTPFFGPTEGGGF